MTQEQDFLLRTGMINRRVYAGIQPDDCVVLKPAGEFFVEASLCNHDCLIQIGDEKTGGNYVCEASYSLNKGCKKHFAPRTEIVQWTRVVARAHRFVRNMFFERYFNSYCEMFRVPPLWADAIRAELTHPDKKVEVNRFGGSPEMHPECAGIIGDCKAMDLVVNLTTPGRRLMNDEKFVSKIAANPPHMLALSFDDLGVEELSKIAKMDLDELKTEWKKVSPHHGQRQKAFEGFYSARLMKKMDVPVTILFNMVIHPGNVGYLDSLLGVLADCLPEALANPYPAQAFGEEKSPWTYRSLPLVRAHAQSFIERTLRGMVGVTNRLHYYVVLEAAFRKWQNTNQDRLTDFLGGIGAWDFTLRPGAYRYVQIGKNTDTYKVSQQDITVPGGHLGCFWNPHLSFGGQIGNGATHLAENILTGMVRRGLELGGVRKSNLMPRLMFDVVSTELGLPDELIPEYLSTRKEYAGY